MLEEIRQNLKERMNNQLDSRTVSDDEVRLAWLISEIDKKNTEISKKNAELGIIKRGIYNVTKDLERGGSISNKKMFESLNVLLFIEV